MHFTQIYLGFSTADAENIRLQYTAGELLLQFVDWKGIEVAVRFRDVLAYRWENEPESLALRDDTTYKVEDSLWLTEQCRNAAIASTIDYAHYKLCFNDCGALDVLSHRLPTA